MGANIKIRIRTRNIDLNINRIEMRDVTIKPRKGILRRNLGINIGGCHIIKS